MKLSVSMSEQDVALLDAFVREAGLPSRSAALQHAVGLLRRDDLEAAYAQAWDEWDPVDRGVWEHAVGDGIG